MVFFAKRYRVLLISGIFLLTVICIGIPLARPILQNFTVQFIIDPGHGLPDGGAVGLDGTTEQILNLQIATKLYSLYRRNTVILVRSDEQGLADISGSIREKKISDMKKRVEIAQKNPNAVWISIHMNTFSDSSVYGCQVFYRKGDSRSIAIANELQNLINEHLQPDHPKKIKTISDDLYLFKNTTNSAILIECGFLTNVDDLSKLKDAEYQKKLSDLIYQATQPRE